MLSHGPSLSSNHCQCFSVHLVFTELPDSTRVHITTSTASHMDASVSAYQIVKLPLDERFYSLSGKELAFFKAHTGIDDDEELKRHIMAVQAKAYEVGLGNSSTSQ